jgi:hypothetical protein
MITTKIELQVSKMSNVTDCSAAFGSELITKLGLKLIMIYNKCLE